MSGIAGILHLDGAPVDRSFVSAMADALAFRGPDAQNVWTDGSVGFAHTLLATTFESEGERQPATLDGQVWITADARIDGRQDLARELGLPQSALLRPDCELILHAYARWGDACVDHLLGDFSFAIWDGRARKLFCARDHFGVKPFYYAHVGSTFVFSNTLDCVRLHPAVSSQLNELAIADFLIFDYNRDPAKTTFRDISCLAASSSLTLSSAPVVRDYWRLQPIDDPGYRAPEDYGNHFAALLKQAVTDRLRTTSVGILLSGGLDSTSIAAFAKTTRGTSVTGHTAVSGPVKDDPEYKYVEIFARHFGVEAQYLSVDCYPLFGVGSGQDTKHPEPQYEAFPGVLHDLLRQASSRDRVILNGDGGDPLLASSPRHFLASLRRGEYLYCLKQLAAFWRIHRCVPQLGIRSALRRTRNRLANNVALPTWLNTELVSRYDLPSRWRAISIASRDFLRKSVLSDPFWPVAFLGYDPSLSRLPVEARHPFFDLRLVQFISGLRPQLWHSRKGLLRIGMRNLLPWQLLARPKTPLRRGYLTSHVRKVAPPTHVQLSWLCTQYVDPRKIAALDTYSTDDEVFAHLRPYALGVWLQQQRLVS
jgi:asparagine synthase (glutamine-hydrolysing)